MTEKVRVPLHQAAGRFVQIDPKATRGATIGVDVFDAAGNLWVEPVIPEAATELKGLMSVVAGSGIVQLVNDVAAPGNTYYYGTGPTGVKGWSTVASTMVGADSVIQSVGSDGVSTFNLDGDVLAPGNGYVYSTNLLTGVKGWNIPPLFESTGVLSTAGLAINGGDNTKFDIGLTLLGMTDYTANPLQPVRTPRVFPATTAITVANLAVVATWVGIDVGTGAVVQQNSKFTSTQLRTIAQLGAVISNGTNLIAVNNLPSWMRAGINQLGDLLDAIGPMNLSGNVIGPNGVNLNLNKSAGVEFKQGANATTNPLDPHKLTLGALTAFTFQYRLSDGTIFANTTTVDPNNYEDPLGTLAAIPAANRFTIQRFSVFTSNLVRAQYGQHVYNTIAEAEASLSTESFATEANIAENGLLLCFLIVQDGATDLSDPTQAKFVPASKFGGPVGSGGTSITNTDGLPEGLVNLYFTDERAQDAVGNNVLDTATVNLTYNDATGQISADVIPGGLSGSFIAKGGDSTTGNYAFGTNVFYIDDTNNRAGAGTATPQRPFHVVGPTGAVATFPTGVGAAVPLVLENNANCIFALVPSTTGQAGIACYKDGSATVNGFFRYDMSSQSWIGDVETVTRITVDANGWTNPGALRDTGVVSPAQLVANTDNWAVTGIAGAKIIRASTDASRNLTGIASPTAGQSIRLCNIGAFNLVLIHDATSTAANRFYCPNNASVTLRPNGWVELWYDSTSSRWRVSGA